jgi:putative ABC transport system permease protein
VLRQLRHIGNILRNLFRKHQGEAELDEEVRSHLELLTDQKMKEGMSSEEASRAAKIELGGVERVKEDVRAIRAGAWLETLLQDVRFGLRMLPNSPVFTATVISALTIGIGANTAIFSVVDAVLLKPLSYPNPERIVQFLLKFPEGPPRPSSSVADFRIWREQTRAFQDASAYDFAGAALSLGGDAPEEVRGVHVTADYFRLFGASMLLGRTFTAEEASPNGGNVVVLGYGLWTRRFDRNPNILGKIVSLGDTPYTVLGVTDRSFQSDPEADLWIPFQFSLNSNDPAHYFQVAGRLKPGITLEQANTALELATAEARRSHSFADSNLDFEVKPLRDMIVGDVQSSLLTMAVAVGLVLLIACGNVANLLLVRATGRRREFAIRSALGAGRIRIVRQLLTESILLSFIGGTLGVAIGLAGIRALLTMDPGNIPRIEQSGVFIGVDWCMLAFTAGLSLFTGILFGLFPALTSSRPDLNNELKESGNQRGAGFRQNMARSLFVISQISLAVVLLVGAALLIRTFIALHEVNPGFDPHQVLTIDMSLAANRFAKTADVSGFVNNARLRINGIPGVQDSAMTCCPPFKSRFGLPFIVVGRSPGNSSSTGDALWTDVSPGYFDVFKIPILRGRSLTERDNEAAPPVVLVNEAMAKQFWPNQNPLGEQIVIGNGLGPRFKDVPRQIIGVVGNTRDVGLSSPSAPAMIIPQAQESDEMTAFWRQFGPAYWLVRTRVAPHQLAPLVAKQLSEASGGVPVGHIRSMDEVMSSSISRQNFNMLLCTIFAASALLLAAVGIYGVVSYSTAQRRREIGIRMALGAQRRDVLLLVMGQGIFLTLAGMGIGLFAAFLVTRLLASLLYGVTSSDPLTFILVSVVLTAAALLASYIPARRATRVDPMVALRYE